MFPKNSLEHIFCVKNAHGLENDTYRNLGDLLPAENQPIIWVDRLKFLLKTRDIFEISVEGSMLAVEVCSGFSSLAPNISRRFPPVSLKNMFSRRSFCFDVSNQGMKSGHNANFTAKMQAEIGSWKIIFSHFQKLFQIVSRGSYALPSYGFETFYSKNWQFLLSVEFLELYPHCFPMASEQGGKALKGR